MMNSEELNGLIEDRSGTDADRMKRLITVLNEAGRAYYAEGNEIMSNFQYDALYDELVSLEEKTGTILSSSPTQNVGYETLSELPKERHASPMLSLNKTKSPDELVSWIDNQEALLSWKMDGLTVVLTFENGKLEKAVTRGNGEVGEIITNNAKVFKNVPVSIPFKGRLVLRGEAIITYSDFEKINETIGDADAKYKNPRNLCSGSVRQLNNKITAERNVRFYAFTLVSATNLNEDGTDADAVDFRNSREEQFKWLKELGFTVVGYKRVTAADLKDSISEFHARIAENDFPSDGLVLTIDDIAYGESLGRTAKFPRNAIALKWQDETAETTLQKIEWSASRTGLINPVAVFDTVELEGTKVSRASVHNVSIVESLELGVGDRITVFKANMIIPQIAENLTRSGNILIPSVCPVCGSPTEILMDGDTKTLVCPNPECTAKHVKRFSHFVARDAMNIDGLSEATLEKLINKKILRFFHDLYHLDRYADEIMDMEGFGKKSFEKLLAAVEASRETTLDRVLYGIGIANIGLSTARLISRHFDEDVDSVVHATASQLTEIDGVGEVIADAFVSYFSDISLTRDFFALLVELNLKKEERTTESPITGKTFVITGSLEHFKSRNELKDLIELLGAKVAGSVSKNTDYLINNDSLSNSAKNTKAKQLGTEIITEEEFLKLVNREDLL